MTERPPRAGRFIVLPADIPAEGAIPLAAYQRAASRTDELANADLGTPILGLFGEVGSLVAALKKKRREGPAFASYDAEVVEELGDVLWYLSTIASHAHLDLGQLAQRARRGRNAPNEPEAHGDATFYVFQAKRWSPAEDDVLSGMTDLAARSGELVQGFRTGCFADREALSTALVAILRSMADVANAVRVDLNAAARANLEKAFSRWPIEPSYPPLSDAHDLPDEQLPRNFEIFIEEQQISGKTYVLQKRNGVIIGDRLTDNKTEKDDYRFHDVFHIAYAVHLGWSPVLRSLFRVKRKSQPELDENEDGARAIIIEEGIASFVFGRALERGLFEGLAHLDYGLLKFVQDFVRGFEPERCALWQWERALLDGFTIFRELKRHRRGLIKANLVEHTLSFEVAEQEQADERAVRSSEVRLAAGRSVVCNESMKAVLEKDRSSSGLPRYR